MRITQARGIELQRAVKTITFTGAANLGAVGNVPLYTVTGQIFVVLITAYCTDSLTEAAPTSTLALGITGNTTLFIAATNVTSIDTGMLWIDATPSATEQAPPSTHQNIVVDANIVGTVAAQNCNGGTLHVEVYWLPLSADAAVVAA